MIRLSNSQFAPCSVSWDETGELIKNNRDQIYLCCNNRCNSDKNNCYSFCEKNPEDYCKFSCDVMNNVCQNICQSSRFDWQKRYFDSCMQDYECLNGIGIIDEKCLINNKNNLIDCCQKKCVPDNQNNDEIDCVQHCNLSYDINIEKSSKNNEGNNKEYNALLYNKEKNIGIYIIIITLLMMIFLFIFKNK